MCVVKFANSTQLAKFAKMPPPPPKYMAYTVCKNYCLILLLLERQKGVSIKAFLHLKLQHAISSVESHKSIITIQQCSVENQKGAIAVQKSMAIAPFWISTEHC